MSRISGGWKRAALGSTLVLGLLSSLGTAPARAQSVRAVPSATKFAGTGASGFNGDFGAATNIDLSAPTYNAVDAQGNLYIADTANNCVRKLDAASGNLTTISGLLQGSSVTCNTTLNPAPTAAQGLLAPRGLVLDGAGNLYIADSGHNCVRELSAGQLGTPANLTTVAGDCTLPSATSLAPSPAGLALDASGNLYIAVSDTPDGIYQVLRHAAGALATTLCTFAGSTSALVPTSCGAGNATATVLNKPAGLAVDPIGNLFIADTGNHAVRQVDSAQNLTTPIATLTAPSGLAFDQAGILFLSDAATNQVFQYVSGSAPFPIAGLATGASGTYNPSQDGQAAIAVPLSAPLGLAVDSFDRIFAVDSQNNIVRSLNFGTRFPSTQVNSTSPSQTAYFEINAPVSLSGSVGSDFKIASNSCSGPLTPSAGPTPRTCAITLQFTPTYPGLRPSALTLTDSAASPAFKYTWGISGTGVGAEALFPPGTISTLAGGLAAPAAVHLDTAGNVYFAEAGAAPGSGDVKFIPAGSTTPTSLIGSGLSTPTALALDAAGNLFIADKGANAVFKLDPNGSLTPLVTGLNDPEALAVDNFGNVYIAEAGAHAIWERYTGGQLAAIAGTGAVAGANGIPAVDSLLVAPSGLAFDTNGVLYVSDRGDDRVYSINTARVIHILAGTGAPSPNLSTAVQDPHDLAADAAGDVYVADGVSNKVILIYSTSPPTVTTLIGTGTAGSSGDGGPADKAQLNNPIGIALDGFANVYVIDAGNQSLRKVTYTNPTLNFGNVATGQTSTPLTATLWNTGNANLNQVGELVMSDNTNFQLDPGTTNCGPTLHFGGTCAFGFVFTPKTPGPHTGTGTITDNSPNPTQVITLIGNAPLASITPQPFTGVYGQPYTFTAGVAGTGSTAPTGTLTFSVNGTNLCPPVAIAGGQASCSPSPTGLDAGTYTVTLTYSGDGTYPPVTITVQATILPAPVTITANDKSRPYGQPNPPLDGTITGLIAAGQSITATYSTTATITSPVGTYPIVPTAVAGPGTKLSNYAITLKNGTLTITAVGLSIIVNNATRIYGTPNPVFTSTITGAVNGDVITVTYSTTATLTSPVGTYPITATATGASGTNYSVNVTAGTLTITQASTALALTTSNASAPANTPVTFTAQVTSPSQIVPNGSVTFADGTTVLGTVALDATGKAAFTTSSLSIGSHTIVATYPGNTNYLPSTASLTQGIVTPLPTGSFSLAITPPYQEVRGAGHNVYQVTVTSVSGFTGPVALSCAGLPQDAGCAFDQPTVTLTANGTATVNMTTTSTVKDAIAMQRPVGDDRPLGMMPLLAWTMFPMQLSGAALVAGGLRRRRESPWKRLLWLLPLVLFLFGIAGCGCPITAFHTYTITVTGTGTSNGAPLSQSATASLSVIQ